MRTLLPVSINTNVKPTRTKCYELTGLTTLGVSNFAKTILDDVNGADMFVTMGAPVSDGVAGYQKLPSGVVIQWGQSVTMTSATGTAQILYPIVFNNVWTVTATYIGTDINHVVSIYDIPARKGFFAQAQPTLASSFVRIGHRKLK